MTRPVMRRTWRTPIPRSHIRAPALLAARAVGRSTYAGTSAVTIITVEWLVGCEKLAAGLTTINWRQGSFGGTGACEPQYPPLIPRMHCRDAKPASFFGIGT